jgi:hypothetical protein
MTDSQFSRSVRQLVDHGLFIPRKNGYLIPDVPRLSRHVCPDGCDFGVQYADRPAAEAASLASCPKRKSPCPPSTSHAL